MKTKKTIGLVLIATIGITSSLATDYTCIRGTRQDNSINLNNSVFYLTNNNDTLSCNDRMNDKTVYFGDGNDTVSGVVISEGSKFYMENGNDTFQIQPGTPEDVANGVENHIFQNSLVDGGSGDDTVIINGFNSDQVVISGNCYFKCNIGYNGDDREFENNTLENIEHIKFDDKVINFSADNNEFTYTIPITGNLVFAYNPKTNARPSVVANASGQNVIAEADMWNLKSENGTGNAYYNQDLNRFTFDVNMANIVPLNSSWTYGDPNIFVGHNIWTNQTITGSGLPVLVNKINSLDVSYSFKIEHPGNPLNFYNEGYITKNEYQNNGPQPGDFEFMILWYHYLDFPPGNKLGTVNIPVTINNNTQDISFDVYSDNDLGTQTFITFMPSNLNLSGGNISYNIKDFLDKIKENYYPNIDNMYLEDWHLGSEFGGGVSAIKERFYIENFKIELNQTTDNNYNCYIPTFGVNGGISLDSNNLSGNLHLGIYYDCNENKEDLIRTYCDTIYSNIIKPKKESYNRGIGLAFKNTNDNEYDNFFQNQYAFMNQFRFQFRYRHKNNLENFYETYCVNNHYKDDITICEDNTTKTVKFYNLYDELQKGAYIGKCNTENNTTETNSTDSYSLPPYVKVNTGDSEIIFSYGKNYTFQR